MKERIFTKSPEILSARHGNDDSKRRVFGFETPDREAALNNLNAVIDGINPNNDISGRVRNADGGFWNNLGGIIGNLGAGAASVVTALNHKYTETRNYNYTENVNRTLMWGGIGVATLLVTGVVLIMVLRKR